MKIISWNVNGIVSCRRKGFLKFLGATHPDVMCIQEIKTKTALHTPGYHQIWNPAKKPGYSGTLLLTKQLPLSSTTSLGIEDFDAEGRMISVEFEHYHIINVYTPSLNVYSNPDRPGFRRRWETALRDYLTTLSKPVILCGDFNVVRESIDTYPKEGKDPERDIFLSDEQGEFETLLEMGFYDVFRTFYPKKADAYTWWGPKNNARENNRGSRLDYFLVHPSLLECIRSVRHHTNVQGSDHCPISLILRAPAKRASITMSDEDLGAMWRAIDWDRVKDEVYNMQSKISKAAYYRDWEQVRKLQDKFVRHISVKYLAVKNVSDTNSAPGIDGVRWLTDAEKARAVTTLSSANYTPLPYRAQEVRDRRNRTVNINIPVIRDRAMQNLYAMALDPVCEATSDHMSFFSRKCRSHLDLHAYLERDLSEPGAPEWVWITDLEAFYASILYSLLLDIIPMDKKMLQKFLTAGVVSHGEMFDTDRGISKGASLSSILGNMVLNGLQSYVYDHLYPEGNVDYPNGKMYRFADDILFTARTKNDAMRVAEIATEFFAERGLRPNKKKTYIADVNAGFVFLSRRYQIKYGMLYSEPFAGSVDQIETDLAKLILNWKGTLRGLITTINNKLTGWQTYHSVEDAYMAGRHIDAFVELTLVRRMCDRYPRWKKKTVLDRFWVNSGGDRVFTHPNDPTCRVKLLAPAPIKRYKPCKANLNPYLDKEYYSWLRERRRVQRHSDKYQAVWRRQEGLCAYCARPMLPDEEVEVVEKELGEGRNVKNLLYVHQRCMFQLDPCGRPPVHPIDVFEMMDDLTLPSPPSLSPYLELTEFFHKSTKSPISLTFKQIEQILGDDLDWEAYFYTAFWYDNAPGTVSPLWEEEGFPFHVLKRTTPDYCIADSWISQGYQIKALYIEKERVVFRRVVDRMSALRIPKELTEQKIPDEAVHEMDEFCKYLKKKYGL